MFVDRYFIVTKRSDKQYSTRLKTSRGIPITLVNIYGTLLEMFGGEFEGTEYYDSNGCVVDDITEIIQTVSWVYDIPEDELICHEIQENDVDKYMTRLIMASQ